MITNFDKQMLNKALGVSGNSIALKRNVGAVIIDNTTLEIVATGYNRTFDNSSCENIKNETFEDVIHAEEDAVLNLLSTNWDKTSDYTMYVTYSPCMNCCKLIARANINRLVYLNEHKTNFITAIVAEGKSPKQFLESQNILVERCTTIDEKHQMALIYHSADNDGKMCGLIFSRVFANEIDAGLATLFPYNYDKTAEWMDIESHNYREFLFADVVPPLEWLIEQIGNIESGRISITIFDHHEDVFKKISALNYKKLVYYYSPDIAGCQILYNVYKMFDKINSTLFEEYVKYVSDYDTWKFVKPEMSEYKESILAVNTYLQQYHKLSDFTKVIDRHFSIAGINNVIEYGNILIEKIKADNDRIIAKGFHLNSFEVFIFDGHPNYWVSEQIEQKFNIVLSYWIGYSIDLKNNEIHFSIRSKNFDSSKIARQFDGNGHKGAAGFTVDLQRGFNIITNPELMFQNF
jgi:dCMP deaminase